MPAPLTEGASRGYIPAMLDRRQLLARGGVIGGVAWVAPALLSTPAHAQGSSPTTTTPPTTAPPVAFAPIAMTGAISGDSPTFVVVDAAGHVRFSPDAGQTWTDPLGGGTVGIAPMGLMAIAGSTVLRQYVVGVDGSVLRCDDALGASWAPDTPLDIAPVAVSPVAGSSRLLATDAAGRVRTASTSTSPLVWTDPLGGGVLATAPVAVNGAQDVLVAVGPGIAVRVSVDGGATWTVPYAQPGGVPPNISPVAVTGMVISGIIATLVLIDAAGALATTDNGGITWAGGDVVPGIGLPVGFASAPGRLTVVDAGGNVRVRLGGVWSTPASSPIT
jgi:hypothetical protein